MRMAHEWLLLSPAAIAICTGSQSLLKAIQSGSIDTAGQRLMPYKRAGKTALLWIPGHHVIAGNQRQMPVLSKRQQFRTVLPDQSPSLEQVHSSAEL